MTVSKAVGEGSFRKASTCSGVGRRPTTAKWARRIRVRLSAGAAGLRLACSSLARINASMESFGQVDSFTAGAAWGLTGCQAQCLDLRSARLNSSSLDVLD